MKEAIMRVVIFILIINLFWFNVASLGVEQNVVVSITKKPKVDIVLAKSRTNTDVSNFEADILKALENEYIDTSDVVVQAVEAETVDLTESFAWKQDVSSAIGSISIVNNGQSVTMKGNQTNPGKNAIWIIPDKNEEQKFTFDYSITFGDSFNAAGMLLNVKEENNILTGYMLSFNNTAGDNWYNSSGGYNGAIWEFSYGIGQNTTNMTKTLKKGLSINSSGTLTVTTTDTKIQIEGGGLSSAVTYEMDKEFGNGYGFFSDHYSHNCSQIGSFELNNINLETTVVKSFEEVLRQPEWRENSYRFLVDITDKQNDELNPDSATYGELATRFINDSIYMIAWGKDVNMDQFNNLILMADNKGTFINNTDYNGYMSQTASYIRSVLDSIESSEYVCLNEPINISVSPEDAKTGTQDENYPYGKWKIIHDYEYYENNIGQFANSGKYIPDMITTFDKTGRYQLTFEDKEITPKYVYVHRKPVVGFDMKLLDGEVELTSSSYDLDNYSNNNGISQEEWKWKLSTDTNWTEGKLTTFDPSKTYIIQLRVKDFQNTWSDPITKYINYGSDVLPIAMFNLESDTITKYETLKINDMSYDPSGKELIAYNYEIYKDNNLIYSGNEKPTNYLDYEIGKYTIYLSVTNSDNLTSEKTSRVFYIKEDKEAPEVVANPIESDWADSVTVNLKFKDKGGSGFKNYQYAITDSQTTPNEWSQKIAEENSSIVINQEGNNKYLHIIAEDNAGNVSEDRIIGPYKIDNSAPKISVDADFDTISTDGINLIANVTDNLSGIKSITINGESYQNGSNYKISKNGTYTIEAIDNLGHMNSKVVNVTNINNICTEGLDHPNYSSDYDECPICELIKNVETHQCDYIYNGENQGISYDNPDNATLVQYYNDTQDIPRDVGTYNYKFKVVYNGKEYNTPFKGTYHITPKTITIAEIEAQNRQYNGTKTVSLRGDQLQGIEEIDKEKVNFELSETGTISSKNIGTYPVNIPEIQLIGEKSTNYSLTQPAEDSVQVEITPKVITITGIESQNRQYNGTKIVSLKGGQLQGIEEIDKEKVSFELSETGTISSKNIGTYDVNIPEIRLIGEESTNYSLIQPSEDTVQVEITLRKISLTEIKAKDKKYDMDNTVEVYGGKLIGVVDQEDVTFILPTEGKAESANVGNWDVEIEDVTLSGNDIHNYELIQPQKGDIRVNILDPEIPALTINAEVLSINEIDGKDTNNKVQDGDIVTLKIKIGNKGLEGGYVKEIAVTLPEEIKFIEDDSINTKYKWAQNEDGMIKTTILCYENGIENIIKPNKKIESEEDENEETKEEQEENYINLELSLLVDKIDENYYDIPIELNMIQTDINNTIIEDTIDGCKDTLNLRTNYSSMAIKENVYSINEQRTASKIVPEIEEDKITYNKTNDNVEVEQGDIVVYNLRVYNEGENNNYASLIATYELEGLEFLPDNEINTTYHWIMLNEKGEETTSLSEAVRFKTNYLSDKIIESYQDEEDIKYEDIQIAFKVLECTEKEKTIENKVEITECRDENNIVIKNLMAEDKIRDTQKNHVKYFDISLKKKLENVQVLENGVITENVTKNKEDDNILKVEIKKKKIPSTSVKFTYSIVVTNEGEIAGYVKEIKDYIPTGLTFISSDNANWNQMSNTIITNNELENESINPGETKEIKVTLTWINSNENFGTFTNFAEISKDYNLSETVDIDSTPDNQDISEDDISSDSVIISVSTGAAYHVLIYIIILIAMIISILILYCSIKVMKIN